MKSIHDWFKKEAGIKEVESRSEKLDIPGNLWVKCFSCKQTIYSKDLEDNLKVCTKCGYHFRLAAPERIIITADAGSFKELDQRDHIKGFPQIHRHNALFETAGRSQQEIRP